MTSDLQRQYAPTGVLRLSTTCIQSALSFEPLNENGVVCQLTAFKVESKGKDIGIYARVKLNDGAFEYSGGVMPLELVEQIERDNLASMDKEDCPVIVIHQLEPKANLSFKSGNVKMPLIIKSYTLLMRGIPKIGTPIGHTGNVADHTGYERLKYESACVDWPTSGSVKMDTDSVPLRAQPTAAAPSTMNSGGLRGPPPPARHSSTTDALGGHITPIASVTPYISKFKILAQVTVKEELRTIKMKTGESKVFNFELTDKTGSSIRVAAFGESAERFFGVVQLDTSYYLSNVSVRPANKRFNSTGHDYELTLTSTSVVQACRDAPTNFKMLFKIKPIKLNELPRKTGELIDVLAIIETCQDLQDFTSRDGREFTKREVTLIDDTMTCVQMVLWGDQARSFPENNVGQALGVKGATVKEFNGGFTLSLNNGAKYALTPDVDGVSEILAWYQSVRPTLQAQTISNAGTGGEGALARDLRLIGAATGLQLGRNEANGMYMTIKARISTTKAENAIYKACASDGCQKKVVEVDGEYRCDKCSTTGHAFKWHYMMQMELMDMTGTFWVTAFGKYAEAIVGMTADQLGELKDNDPASYDEKFEALKFIPRNFRIRAKAEVYNDEERVKYSVYNVDKPNYERLAPVLDGVIAKLAAFQQ